MAPPERLIGKVSDVGGGSGGKLSTEAQKDGRGQERREGGKFTRLLY